MVLLLRVSNVTAVFEKRLVGWKGCEGQRKKAPGSVLFSAEGCPSSIVGAEVFHFRVRNENGWAHLAIATAVPLFSDGC